MFTAPNPGPKTLEGTHTYVVGGAGACVLDPGPDILSYQESLARWLRQRTAAVQAILLSHGHPDHAPGARALRRLVSAPIWASDLMPDGQAAALGVDRRFSPGQAFEVDGDEILVVATPGHTPDHVGFWLAGARIFFSADTILGTGTTLVAPPEGDMLVYMQTLEAIRHLRPRLIAPGHGPLIADPDAKIEEYVEHRRRREQQLLGALESGPASVEELVQAIYTDVDPRVLDLARGSLEAQLLKLESEGRVRTDGERYRLT